MQIRAFDIVQTNFPFLVMHVYNETSGHDAHVQSMMGKKLILPANGIFTSYITENVTGDNVFVETVFDDVSTGGASINAMNSKLITKWSTNGFFLNVEESLCDPKQVSEKLIRGRQMKMPKESSWPSIVEYEPL